MSARCLPAEPFAHEVLALLVRSQFDVDSFAASIGVDPCWLQQVLAGDIAQLPLPEVVWLCRCLRLMPEDIWDPGDAAHAFEGWPANTFD